MHDELGDRMKKNYENRSRYYLPRRTYTLIRLDGKAFHTFTRGCQRPFDADLMSTMDDTAVSLCMQIEGAKLAYVQSDEISILMTDFTTEQTEAWFDGNIQKICSISASLATVWFDSYRSTSNSSVLRGAGKACFDSRVFTIPDPVEVENYFIWRQQDAVRNSIQMAAQAQFSHNELDGIGCNELQEKLFQEKGINWNDYPVGCKRGRCVIREKKIAPVTYTDRRTGEERTSPAVERNVWSIVDPPTFTQDRDWLSSRIPKLWQEERELVSVRV